MAWEIERKFLVTSDAWKVGARGTPYRQGYLSVEPERTVRVRLQGDDAKLTIKGKKLGSAAPEFEYDIPKEDGHAMLERLCLRPLVEKTRYKVRVADGHVWDVDEFRGLNDGLVLAEIELTDEREKFDRPSWLGAEVTGDSRYANANLSQRPHSTWD